MDAIALRYVTRFRCIAADCEDPCCIGWGVPVDEPHLVRLRAAMGDAIDAAVHKPSPPRPGIHALMVLEDDARCVMLEPDGLCTIQKHHGEDLLPDTCAVYPRSVGEVAGRLELAASLSCPEAARLCFADDDALDLVEVDRALALRPLVHKSIPEGPLPPWAAFFDDVRALALDLLADPRFPVESRLFFLGYLGHALHAVYRPDAPVDEAKVRGVIALLERPEARTQLDAQLRTVPRQDPFALNVVAEVLAARRRSDAPRVFVRLTSAILGDAEPDRPSLLVKHMAARQALPPPFAARLDRAVERFARNFIFRDWFLRAPSLLAHVQALLVRLATIRFLALAHPARTSTTDEKTFDAQIVEAVYGVARLFDHDDAFMRDVIRSLAAQNMQTLAHLVSLLRF